MPLMTGLILSVFFSDRASCVAHSMISARSAVFFTKGVKSWHSESFESSSESGPVSFTSVGAWSACLPWFSVIDQPILPILGSFWSQRLAHRRKLRGERDHTGDNATAQGQEADCQSSIFCWAQHLAPSRWRAA